ncbi:ASCH domain-containing protein [Variovorax sp. JS1663]|uniref:ASCH domain-containing protein n=1 Tax=Variovorax sp. JS1663 TaxID=1851577 RepID=UPI001EE0697C|nr:ASCH domain-containing protein [Variovorax sp. JS1663]
MSERDLVNLVLERLAVDLMLKSCNFDELALLLNGVGKFLRLEMQRFAVLPKFYALLEVAQDKPQDGQRPEGASEEVTQLIEIQRAQVVPSAADELIEDRQVRRRREDPYQCKHSSHGYLQLFLEWQYDAATRFFEAFHFEVVPFEQVTAEFAATEGEGDSSLAWWREAHWRYFGRECARIGRTPSQHMPVVCERFRVAFKGDMLSRNRAYDHL